MPKKPAPLSCDWKTPEKTRKSVLRTRLYRHKGDFSWQGVKTEKYKSQDGTWAEVLRRVLVGTRGENTKFHLRYFEISPGGYTTLEHHRHEHVVVGIRGKGRCLVKGKNYDIGFLDVLYIPPDAPHQLKNPFKEPFGFFCLVDSKRDRPKPLKK